MGLMVQDGQGLIKVEQGSVLDRSVSIPISCRYDGTDNLSATRIHDSIEWSETWGKDYEDYLLSMPLVNKLYMLYEILRIKGEKDGSTFKYRSGSLQNIHFVGSLASTSGISAYFFNELVEEHDVNLLDRATFAQLDASMYYSPTQKPDKYYLQVPSGMVVYRRHGRVYIAG